MNPFAIQQSNQSPPIYSAQASTSRTIEPSTGSSSLVPPPSYTAGPEVPSFSPRVVAASSFLSLRSSGNIEVLNGRLLEAGRNVDHGKISSLLIQGANINAVTRDRGRNILHKIFKHAKPEDVGKVADAVKLVLDKGGDINLFDTKGATPLMLAKKYGWLDQTQVRSVIAQNIPDIEKQLRVSDANSSDVVATFIQNQQDELHERVAFML